MFQYHSTILEHGVDGEEKNVTLVAHIVFCHGLISMSRIFFNFLIFSFSSKFLIVYVKKVYELFSSFINTSSVLLKMVDLLSKKW